MKTMNTLTSALRLTRLSRLTRFSLALTAFGFATNLYAYRLPSNTTF